LLNYLLNNKKQKKTRWQLLHFTKKTFSALSTTAEIYKNGFDSNTHTVISSMKGTVKAPEI